MVVDGGGQTDLSIFFFFFKFRIFNFMCIDVVLSRLM